MKNSKNKRTTILAVILVALLIVAYKVVFMSNATELLAPIDNSAAGQEVVGILEQIQGISFDTSVINDQKFQSLLSIETPLPALPVGKKNPFSIISN